MNCSAFEKRLTSPNSATIVTAATSAMPHKACKASTTGASAQSTNRFFIAAPPPTGKAMPDILDFSNVTSGAFYSAINKAVAALLRGVDRCDTILQHDMVRVLRKALPGAISALHITRRARPASGENVVSQDWMTTLTSAILMSSWLAFRRKRPSAAPNEIDSPHRACRRPGSDAAASRIGT